MGYRYSVTDKTGRVFTRVSKSGRLYRSMWLAREIATGEVYCTGFSAKTNPSPFRYAGCTFEVYPCAPIGAKGAK